MYQPENIFTPGLIFFYLILYVYMAWCLMVIAQKTGHGDSAWMAWIPIINIFLMLMVGNKPAWWIILLFIPIVNLIIAVITWMGIAEARGRESWWGILIFIPGVNLIVPAVLASGD